MSNSTSLNILVITQYFEPARQAGGGLRSLLNLIRQSPGDLRYTIISGNQDVDGTPLVQDDHWQEGPFGRVLYLPPGRRGSGRLRREIRAIPADLLVCNSFFSSLCRRALWLRYTHLVPRCPAVTFTRGELSPIALSLKPRRKALYLWGVRHWLGVYRDIHFCASDPHEADRIRRWFPRGQIHQLPEPVVAPDQTAGIPHSPPKQPGQLKLIFLGRVSPIKNLTTGLKALADVQAEIDLTIYGPMEDREYWRQCRQIIATLPDHIQVTYGGTLGPEDALDTLARSHCMLLPTLGENFGHVIAESLLAGTPVVLSDQTPWSQLAECGAGWICPADRPGAFTAALQESADMDQAAYDVASQAAVEYGRQFLADHLCGESWAALVKSLIDRR